MVKEKSKSGVSKSLGKFSFWKISSIVLALILLVIIIVSLFDSSDISSSEAGEKVMVFVNSQVQGASLVSVTEKSGLYEVNVSVNGRVIPLYITEDGLNLVTNLIPLDVAADDGSSDGQPAPTQNIPKSDKPEVNVFVMSHCPYGVKAQEIVVPVMRLLGSKAEIKTRFVPYAMHGKQELDDNNIEYCIQKEQEDKFDDFLSCFVGSQNSAQCVTTAGIDKTKLDSCVAALDTQYNITNLYNDKSTWLSGRYPKYPVEQALAEQFDAQGSETMIINGVKVSPSAYRWDANKLKNLICGAFNTAPAECSQTLSGAASSAPSDGSCG